MSHCFNCKDEIVLQRSEGTGKWIKINPNGSAHTCKTVDAKAKTISPLNVSSAYTQEKEMEPIRTVDPIGREANIMRMHNENIHSWEENTKAQLMVASAIQRLCDVLQHERTNSTK